MKLIAILAACLLATGCASTKVYRDGKPIFATQADAEQLEFSDGATRLSVKGLSHSKATAAGGSSAAKIIQSTGTAAGAIGAAIATGGAVK